MSTSPLPDRAPGWAWREQGRIERAPNGRRLFGPLVHWLRKNLIVRLDVFGGYRRKKGDITPTTHHAALTAEEVAAHLARAPGENVEDAIGFHLVNGDDQGRCIVIDIDDHAKKTTETAERNSRYGRHLFHRLKALGATPIVLDYGAGSVHVWLPFMELVPAAILHLFGRWVVSDAELHGFEAEVESFPKRNKQNRPTPFGGGWVRAPGQHAKRADYPRVWNGGRWLEEEEAIDFIVSITAADHRAVIPQHIFQLGEERAQAKLTKPAPAPVQVPTATARVQAERTRYDSPGSDFNRRGRLEETGIFESGWKWASGGGLTRPGKDSGISATFGMCTSIENRWPLFHCFTTN